MRLFLLKNRLFTFAILMLLIILACVPAFAACNHLNQTERIVVTGSYTENGQVYVTRENRVTCTDCGADLGWNDLPPIVCDHATKSEELVSVYHFHENGSPSGVAEYDVVCSLCGMYFGFVDRPLDCSFVIHGQNEQHFQSDGHSTTYEIYYKCTDHNAFVSVETEEPSEHTVKYSNIFKNSAGKYGKTITTICNDCGEVVSSVFSELNTDGDLYTLVATSENGERMSNETIYHIGFTGKTVGMGAGQNIVSHARRSGFFNDFSNLVVFNKDGKYYVFGCHSLSSFSGYDGNVTDLVGSPVFISSVSNSADLADIMPVGERFETYACQLLYENGVLYYNGKPLALDSGFFQFYKRQFQYLTQTNMILPELSRTHWLEDLDFSICRFVDIDNDGDQDRMFYDTRLLIDGYSLDTQNRVKFASCGEEDSILVVDGDTTYSPFTRWLTNNYLPFVDLRSNRSTAHNIVYVRMYESATTATCVDNAVVFLENVPEQLNCVVKIKFDASKFQNGEYVPVPSDFEVYYSYSSNITRTVPTFLVTPELISDGSVKIYVADKLVKVINYLPWKDLSWGAGYDDGFRQGQLAAGDWLGALIGGTWDAVSDGVTVVLDHEIAGFNGWDIVMGLLVILVIFIAAVLIFKK